MDILTVLSLALFYRCLIFGNARSFAIQLESTSAPNQSLSLTTEEIKHGNITNTTILTKEVNINNESIAQQEQQAIVNSLFNKTYHFMNIPNSTNIVESNQTADVRHNEKTVSNSETDANILHIKGSDFASGPEDINNYIVEDIDEYDKYNDDEEYDDIDNEVVIDYIVQKLIERRNKKGNSKSITFNDDDASSIHNSEQISKEDSENPEQFEAEYKSWLYDYFQDEVAQSHEYYSWDNQGLKSKSKISPSLSTSRIRSSGLGFKPGTAGSSVTGQRPRRQGGGERGRRKRASHEYTIKRTLLRGYDTTSRPVMNDSTPVTVSVGMSLFHILDTNEKMQTLSALISIRLRWQDEYLEWDPSEYGGVQTIWIPAMQIWTPDIFINNFADDSFQDFMNTYAIVQHTGGVLWMFPAVIKTYCTLDVRHFPFDKQKCDIVFISWTFNGFKVNITYNESEHSAIYYKPKNQEWYVDQVGVKRNEKIYACCEEPYPDVTFTIFMTRRSLFYIVNLIFPCLLIYTVSFLGFYLPVESGEKVNLEITILLALVVFLLMVGETLPPTPDAIPALGLLFGTTMLMVSIALVMAVIVTNLYFRKDSGDRVPYCVRKLFLPGPRQLLKQRRRYCTSLTNKGSVKATKSTNTSHGTGCSYKVHSGQQGILKRNTGNACVTDNYMNENNRMNSSVNGRQQVSNNREKHLQYGVAHGVRHEQGEMDRLSTDSTTVGAAETGFCGACACCCIECNESTAHCTSAVSALPTVTCFPSRRSNAYATSDAHYTPGDPISAENLTHLLEWQQLAKCVDRICFWLFLFSSITALSAIFISIPNNSF